MTRTIRTSRHTPSWLLQKLDEKTFSFVKKHVHPFLRGEKLKNNGELPGNMPLLRSFVVYLGFHNKDFKALNADLLSTTQRGVQDIYDLIRKRTHRHLDEKPPTPASIYAVEAKTPKASTSPTKSKSPAQIKEVPYNTKTPKTPSKGKITPRRKKLSETESDKASSVHSVAQSSKRISKGSSASSTSSKRSQIGGPEWQQEKSLIVRMLDQFTKQELRGMTFTIDNRGGPRKVALTDMEADFF